MNILKGRGRYSRSTYIRINRPLSLVQTTQRNHASRTTSPRKRCAFKTHPSRIQSDDNTTPLFVAFFRENRHRTRVISDDRAALRAPPRRVRNARGRIGFDFEAKCARFTRTKNASRRERRRGGGRNASRETLRGFYRGAESDGIPTREESVGEG